MRKEERSLLWVWIALLALLAASTGSALLRLGTWNGPLGLAIAAVKAGLVLWFFMRLRSAHSLVRLVAMAGLLALAALFILSGSDYATRSLAPAPVQAPAQITPWGRG